MNNADYKQAFTEEMAKLFTKEEIEIIGDKLVANAHNSEGISMLRIELEIPQQRHMMGVEGVSAYWEARRLSVAKALDEHERKRKAANESRIIV